MAWNYWLYPLKLLAKIPYRFKGNEIIRITALYRLSFFSTFSQTLNHGERLLLLQRKLPAL